MQLEGLPDRTIWREASGAVAIIDQTRLPHRFEIRTLTSLDDAVEAIVRMRVRGAPLIGVTAAYGIALALSADASNAALRSAADLLTRSRPTAINLRWAVDRCVALLWPTPQALRAETAWSLAAQIADEDIAQSAAMGRYGLDPIRTLAERSGWRRLNILTHCNAGWLAAVQWGTATAPIYMAHQAGIDLHVYVDETRPRNQGASLTAWELGRHGVPHTVIPDNTGGHLMQHGLVDMVIVGTDRTTATGDVCNKIGTYLKALAAFDNNVPFYVAAPSSSIDFTLRDGVKDIPIEERSPEEVTHMQGLTSAGTIETVRIVPEGSPVANYGFDVTPARLVTGLITERGVIAATETALAMTFPDRVILR
jgi:methylthioribose-1-phosphate isomerase